MVRRYCMEKCEKKYKRKPVNWFKVLLDSDSEVLYTHFRWFVKNKKVKSVNRIAYNILKRYYSTTALANFRKYGVPLDRMSDAE